MLAYWGGSKKRAPRGRLEELKSLTFLGLLRGAGKLKDAIREKGFGGKESERNEQFK